MVALNISSITYRVVSMNCSPASSSCWRPRLKQERREDNYRIYNHCSFFLHIIIITCSTKEDCKAYLCSCNSNKRWFPHRCCVSWMKNEWLGENQDQDYRRLQTKNKITWRVHSLDTTRSHKSTLQLHHHFLNVPHRYITNGTQFQSL